MGVERSRRWRIASTTAWTASDNDIVALNLASPAAHPMTMEDSAAYVWEEIAAREPITADALIRNIAEAYHVGEEIVRNDVFEMLKQLSDEKLITPSER